MKQALAARAIERERSAAFPEHGRDHLSPSRWRKAARQGLFEVDPWPISRPLCLLQGQPDMPEQFPADRLYASARVNGSDVLVLGSQLRHQR